MRDRISVIAVLASMVACVACSAGDALPTANSTTSSASRSSDGPLRLSGSVDPRGTWLVKGRDSGEGFLLRVERPAVLLQHRGARFRGKKGCVPDPLVEEGCGATFGVAEVDGETVQFSITIPLVETEEGSHRRLLGFQVATESSFELAVAPDSRSAPARSLFHALRVRGPSPATVVRVIRSIIDGSLANRFDYKDVDEQALVNSVEKIIRGKTQTTVGF